MKIWKLVNDQYSNFRPLIFEKEVNLLPVLDYVFKSATTVIIPRVKYMPEEYLDSSQPILYGDYPCINGIVPVFSKHAIDVLSARLELKCDLINLESKDGSFVLCRPQRLENTINFNSSEIIVKKGAYIHEYKALSFNESALLDFNIFFSREISTEIFVSDNFRNVALDNSLRGMKFIGISGS